METGTQEVESGIIMADKAGTSLKEIVTVSQRVTDMVTQIAVASEEQSTASGTQQIAHAAEDLNRLSENLQQLVERFKITKDFHAGQSGNAETGSISVRANGKLIKNKK